MSTLQGDFNAESLTSFEFRGAAKHWSFKTVDWHPEESALHVCVKPSPRFASDGLVIRQLTIASSSGKGITCDDASTSGKSKLTCDDSSKTTIVYQSPAVANPTPKTQPPLITKLASKLNGGNSSNVLHLEVTSTLDLVSGQFTISSSDANGTQLSQIIYQDQLKGRVFDLAFDRDRLPAGFTRVEKVELFDSVGNASLLKIAKAGDATYTRFTEDASPTSTQLSVISLFGGASK